MNVLTGLEVLRARGFDALKGQRIGLLTNPSAVTRDVMSAYDVLRTAPQVGLRALFSPEHGFAASVRDGVYVASSIDPRTGVPIHSLYGATMRPTPDMLAELDAVVCDIQDIGVRYYTYAWTISALLEAAGAAGVEVVLLDRPNPLGDAVDGALVEPDYLSIVGGAPIPVQHGLTLGELMRLYNAHWNPTPAALRVIACEGYRRGMTWAETGLPFVPPSPAMPHLSTAQQYPGACLVEGTNLSEGRGTALPFEICGAPFMDGRVLAECLNGLGLSGVRFRPHVFTPTASKWAGEQCEGVQAHITDDSYRPLLTWVAVIREARRLYPADFTWLPPFAGSQHPPFDLLAGGAALREQIEADVSLADIAAAWDVAAEAWRATREETLSYGS